MGVKQLWPLLEEADVVETWTGADPTSLRSLAAELEGCVLAVDLSMWLVQAMEQGALAPHFSPVEAATKVTFERSINLLRFGVTPVFVLEGLAPAEKAEAQRRRMGWAPGATPAAAAARPSSTLFTRLGDHVAAVLRAMGFLVLQAPGEAEATCAALATAHAVHAVLSFDGDTLLFGAGAVYRSLRLSAVRDSTCEASWCRLDAVRRALGLTAPGSGPAALALLGGLMGCDYDAQGAQGVGPGGALALVRHLVEKGGSGDDAALLDGFDALLARPADAALLALTQCTGCARCGHEGGRKGKVKAHTAKNPCPCCPPAAVPPGHHCCERTGPERRCGCAFHARAEERRVERIAERLRGVPVLGARVREAAGVYARGATEAAAHVNRELAALGVAPGAKLGWLHRPRVAEIAAALGTLPGPRQLTWDLSTLRAKTLPALLEWDLRRGGAGLEFRPAAVRKVHGSAGGGAGAAWRYLVEFERTEADVEGLGRKLRDVEAEKEASQGSQGGPSQPAALPADPEDAPLLSAVEFDRRWLGSAASRSHRPVRIELLRRRWPAVEAAWGAKAAGAPAPRTARKAGEAGASGPSRAKKIPAMPSGALDRFLVPRRREAAAAAAKPAPPAPPARGLAGQRSQPAESNASSHVEVPPGQEEQQQESPAKRQRGTPPRMAPPETPSHPGIPQSEGLRTLQRLLASRTARKERTAAGLAGEAPAEETPAAALDRVRRRGGEVGRMLSGGGDSRGGAVEVISLLGDDAEGGGATAAGSPAAAPAGRRRRSRPAETRKPQQAEEEVIDLTQLD